MPLDSLTRRILGWKSEYFDIPCDRITGIIDYPVCAADGEVLGLHRRVNYIDAEGKRAKDFRWFSPDRQTFLEPDGSYDPVRVEERVSVTARSGLGGRKLNTLPFYGQHRLAAWAEELRGNGIAPAIVIAEGEKAAEALWSQEVMALGVANGAPNHPDNDTLRLLAGYQVINWPDNDQAGQQLTQNLSRKLRGIAERVRVVEWPEAGPADDAHDFIAAAGEGVKDALDNILMAARRVVWETEADIPAPEEARAEQEQLRMESRRELSLRIIAELRRLGFEADAQEQEECREYFRAWLCIDCSYQPANPISCKQPLCPRCFPGRLKADWLKQTKKEVHDMRFRLYKGRPANEVDMDGNPLKQTAARFREWRDRNKVSGGVFGYRYDAQHGCVILLALHESQAAPEDGPAFVWEPALASGETVSSWTLCDWLTEQYVEEVEQALDAGLYVTLMHWSKMRRRFQGFGTCYHTPSQSAVEDSPPTGGVEEEEESPEEVKVVLGKLSGGSLSKVSRMVCPKCGGTHFQKDLTKYPMDLAIKDEHGYRWSDLRRKPAEIRR